MAISRKYFPYFALPPEIRNRIMEYVLIPGDVYIPHTNEVRRAQQARKSLSSRLKCFVNSVNTLSHHLSGNARRLVGNGRHLNLERDFTTRQPGFQLLATCKQAYNEGYYMFYAMNTFHVPPGPVNDIDGWYPNLQPKHKKIVKSICIDISLADMKWGGMEDVERFATQRRGGRPDEVDGYAWSYEAMYKLELRIWEKFISLFYSSSPQNMYEFVGLERVVLQNSAGCYLSSGGCYELDLPFWNCVNGIEFLKQFMYETSRYFDPIIQSQVNERGWKKTKKWIEERGSQDASKA